MSRSRRLSNWRELWRRGSLIPGPGLILEAGSYGDWLWNRVEAVRERGRQVEVISFQLHCPLEICARRVEERRKRDPENYILDEEATLALRERWEEHDRFIPEGTVRIDASGTVDEAMAKIREAGEWKI